MTKLKLDVRDLPAPEPLIKALSAAESLQEGEILELLVHREPHMLFPELDALRIPWKIISHGHPDWIIQIGPIRKVEGIGAATNAGARSFPD